jgi:hypothetical protein
MKTRSQTTHIQEFEVNIDFDEASRLWNSNKKKLSTGCYEYVCGKELENGHFCKRKPKNSQYCWIHKHKNIN